MPAEAIMYRDLESPIGALVAGATSKGLSFLEFKDRWDLDRTRDRIRKQYKLDMISGTNAFLDQLESELGRYFSGELQDFSIPLDLKGTPFQLAVWKQLRNIPYGNTNRLSEETRVQALNVLRRYRMMTANGSIPFGVDGVFGFAKNGKNLLALRASSYP